MSKLISVVSVAGIVALFWWFVVGLFASSGISLAVGIVVFCLAFLLMSILHCS